MGLGLIVNETGPWCEWLAVRLVSWSARRRYTDKGRAAVRGEELAALIKERPGQLTKLMTALGFATAASAHLLATRRARATVGVSASQGHANANSAHIADDTRFMLMHSQLVDRIPTATGRALDYWFDIVENGPAFMRLEERAHWLADSYGVSHGYASAIAHEHNIRRRSDQ
jgi:hypothetical protein